MKSVVVVSYAINGRGLGHLVRQLAILRWMRRYAGAAGVKLEAWVLTSSEADTLARREGFPSLKIPSKAMMRDADLDPTRYLAIARSWVVQTIAGLQPDLLVVDTFPGGSFGELVAALELAKRRVFVARPVRDEVAAEASYKGLLPLYDATIVPDDGGAGPILIREREELMDRAAARAALGIPEGKRAVWLTLGGGGDPAAAQMIPRLIGPLRARGWHVVVAAGPLYQGPEIRGDGVTWLDRYLAMELLPGVDAAVSAGGYNAFHELMYVGVPTVFLPQPRIADDQAGRVRRAVDAGAGRLAATLDEVPDLLESPGTAEAARALVPRNGAADAAARILARVLPREDVEAARRAWRPALLASPAARGLSPARLLEVVRTFAGDAPTALASRKAAAADAAERGTTAGSASPEAFLALVDRLGSPPDGSAQVLHALARCFPAARPVDLLAACEALWPVFARFDDWPGALALVRAIPTQRGVPLAAFVQAMITWLPRERDLFDAQRAFVRPEASGARGAPEVLRLLAQRDPVEEPLLTAKAPGTGWRDPYLAAMRDGVVRAGPMSVHLDVTNGCNAACVTCWDHSPLLTTPRTSDWKRRRLPLERFHAIVDQLAALRSVRHVVLSGMGEPLTHPAIYDMIARIKAEGWELTVITNLVAADADRLATSGVDQLLVGVQGVTPDSYAAFHPGWTEKQFFTMTSILRRLQHGPVRVRHVQVIERDTAPEVVAMVRFAKTFGADRVNYKLASLRAGTEACALTEEQRAWLVSDGIPEARALATKLGVRTNLDVFARQVSAGGRATAPMPEIGCHMGYVFTRITVDEDVLYCCNTNVRVGSLADASFAALWTGDAWNALRGELRAGRFLEACDQCGKIEQNARWAALLDAVPTP